MANIDVSIVMCTHNRAAMLRDALDSLMGQQTDGRFTYEIVLVHTASPDGTLSVIDQARQRSHVPIVDVHEPRPGQVVARNVGLETARGKWIAHFDDDQVAEPDWLKELLALARDKNVKSVGGALYLRLPDGCRRKLRPDCRRALGESVDWTTARAYTRNEGPGTGNQMVHRSVFEVVGKYDESFSLRGYDTDMYRRIREAGFDSWFAPRAIAYHVTPAERLDEEYFRETSLHNGWLFARRDRVEWGAAATVALMCARFAKMALIGVPRLAWARLTGDREQMLEGRVRLWRAEGYTRNVLYESQPRLFRQQAFFSRYEFRAEKRMAT